MSRKTNRDHTKKKQCPMVEERVIAEYLTTLLTPMMTSQSKFFRECGLTERILTLPLMVAAVLTLLWRDVPGVTELARLLETEGFLWCQTGTLSRKNVCMKNVGELGNHRIDLGI